jgi:hypothetical protein
MPASNTQAAPVNQFAKRRFPMLFSRLFMMS